MSIGSSKRPVYVDDNGLVRPVDIGSNVKLIGTDKDGNLVATDASSITTSIINYIYPVGSVYITVGSSLPSVIANMGTWKQLATGTTLWNVAPSSDDLGKTIQAGLPDIKGSLSNIGSRDGTSINAMGAFTDFSKDEDGYGFSGYERVRSGYKVTFEASKSNSIYGRSTTVQPPAVGVTMWKRVK